MLNTPLGNIRILVDGKEIPFLAQPYQYPLPPVSNDPIEGCFRIDISGIYANNIKCELLSNSVQIRSEVDSGENYLCRHFLGENICLTIGTVDMGDDWESRLTLNGLAYCSDKVFSNVVFGVAWTTDYHGEDDCRTWYAADPSVDSSFLQ